MSAALGQYLEKKQRLVDRSLRGFLRRQTAAAVVHEAMVYSVMAGGKRLRPILVMAAAEACGLDPKKVLKTACALELIHTYSLVHDDLPAMDNDDLRRGLPTNHKKYGEAIAILAGDGLLTQAFELIASDAQIRQNHGTLARVIQAVAQGAGTLGMVGGQTVDIQFSKPGLPSYKNHLSAAQKKKVLDYIHRHKTAALITASLKAGALWAHASPRQLKALETYGRNIGLAFQIADDILDILGDKKKLGKSGSDAKNKKLTYPVLYGIEASRQKARTLVQEAKEALKIFGSKARILCDLADYIVQREK